MILAALTDLLNCLPDDCLSLPVEIEVNDSTVNASLILIDPPNNLHRARPRIVITDRVPDPREPTAFCWVTPRG
jgi:hypothetical protein